MAQRAAPDVGVLTAGFIIVNHPKGSRDTFTGNPRRICLRDRARELVLLETLHLWFKEAS